jgi:hypothetical protein
MLPKGDARVPIFSSCQQRSAGASHVHGVLSCLSLFSTLAALARLFADQPARVSRYGAFDSATTWLRSDGKGLPYALLGRRLPVPRAAIAKWAAIGSERVENELPSVA